MSIIDFYFLFFIVFLQQPSGKPAVNPASSAERVERPSGLFLFTTIWKQIYSCYNSPNRWSNGLLLGAFNVFFFFKWE